MKTLTDDAVVLELTESEGLFVIHKSITDDVELTLRNSKALMRVDLSDTTFARKFLHELDTFIEVQSDARLDDREYLDDESIEKFRGLRRTLSGLFTPLRPCGEAFKFLYDNPDRPE